MHVALGILVISEIVDALIEIFSTKCKFFFKKKCSSNLVLLLRNCLLAKIIHSWAITNNSKSWNFFCQISK